MKTVLRHFVIDTYCLWLVSNVASGMVFENGYKTLFIAGIGITVVSLLAKPVINVLLLPINLLTFGLFRFLASAVILFLVTLLVKQFKIIFFSYPGLSNKWLDLPPVMLEGFLAFIAFSLILSVLSSFIYWLIK